MSVSDEISKSVSDIGKFLENLAPAAPFKKNGNTKLEALRKLAEHFRIRVETDAIMDATLRVEVDQTVDKSEGLIHSPCLITTPEPKQIKISR